MHVVVTDPLDVFAPLVARVVTRDLNDEQVVVGHVRRQLGGTLTTAAADTCTQHRHRPDRRRLTDHTRRFHTPTCSRRRLNGGSRELHGVGMTGSSQIPRETRGNESRVCETPVGMKTDVVELLQG